MCLSAYDQIDEAIRIHALWKEHIRVACETRKLLISITNAKDESACAFGRWLFREDTIKMFLDDKNYHDVINLHKAFHLCASNALEHALKGRLHPNSDRDALHLYDTASDLLIMALVKWRDFYSKV